jgi:hypothetical protein
VPSYGFFINYKQLVQLKISLRDLVTKATKSPQTSATQNAKLENEMITSADLHLFIRQSIIIAADALNYFYENNFW